MNAFKNSWRKAYFAALTETDSCKLSARVSEADDAIFESLLELEGSTGTDKERVALEDTMRDLRALRAYSNYLS